MKASLCLGSVPLYSVGTRDGSVVPLSRNREHFTEIP